MPRFSIKRKTRQPEPEVVVEEKIDETEISLESEYESSEESEPPTEQFQTLNIAETAETIPQQQIETQYQPQRSSRATTLAHQHTIPVQHQPDYRQVAPQQRRVLGQPRLMEYPRPSRSSNGRRKLQFRSHFGPNGYAMSTQDKARRLYNSCFG